MGLASISYDSTHLFSPADKNRFSVAGLLTLPITKQRLHVEGSRVQILTPIETDWSSDPAGNWTTNLEPDFSSEWLRGLNRQTTRMVSCPGTSLPSGARSGRSDMFGPASGGPGFESWSESGMQLVEYHSWTKPRTSKSTSVRRILVMNQVSLEELQGVLHWCSVEHCLEGLPCS